MTPLKLEIGELVYRGFEAALEKRAIAAADAANKIRQKLQLIGDDLSSFTGHHHFSLPFFKAVALRYNAINLIGDNRGDEQIYAPN